MRVSPATHSAGPAIMTSWSLHRQSRSAPPRGVNPRADSGVASTMA